MSIQILGVSFTPLTKEIVFTQVQVALASQKNLRIATVNPEYLLAGQGNPAFRESLQKADIRTGDGFGIELVAWLHGVKLPRVTGADLLVSLLDLAESQSIPVAIYNKKESLSSDIDIKQALEKQYPNLQVTYNLDPGTYSLVLCTYGAPEQELFLDTLETLGIKIGIGGALDYLTGKQSRAPLFLQSIGLEWLWRLIHQPRRIRRIRNAVISFPFRVLRQKENRADAS